MNFSDRLRPAPLDGGFRMAGYWVWCGSATRGPDGLYHMFAARWPRELPFFDGYKVASEIVRAVSRRAEGPYEFAEVVLPDRGADSWDGRMTHNPTVVFWRGACRLFYIGATYEGPRPSAAELHAGTTETPRLSYDTIRIGMASAPSPKGPWERPDTPVLDVRPGHWDCTVITNPAPCVRPEGGLFLYYRSNTPKGCRLGLAQAAEPGESFERAVEGPILDTADEPIEDPFVWWSGERYELLAKDLTDRITGEWHAGVHAWSDDGLAWQLCDPPKAYSRTVRWADGTSTVQGCLERPQLLLENGIPTCLFAATGDGPGGFEKADNTWNMAIPLG